MKHKIGDTITLPGADDTPTQFVVLSVNYSIEAYRVRRADDTTVQAFWIAEEDIESP